MPRVGRLIRATGFVAIASLVLTACNDTGFDQSSATKVLQSVDVNLASDGAIREVDGSAVFMDELSGDSDSSQESFEVEEVVDDLPVRVSTQYTTKDETGTDLEDLEGHTGRVEIDVTVENLTLESQDLTYDVAGESRETPALVGTPLSIAGSVELEGTGASSVHSDPEADVTTNGVVSQTSEGDAIVQWGTVLAPPQSEATTTFKLVADVEDFAAPEFDIAVQTGFHTDMSFEGMVASAFDTSSSSEYAMQQDAIELVTDVNDVLTSAGTTITDIRSTLNHTTETLGVDAAAQLRQNSDDMIAEMERVGEQLTALESQVEGSMTGAENAMNSQLSQMVSSMSSLLGDTSATRQNLVQGEGCSATLRDAESNGTIYSSIVLLGAQLDGYAEANAECRDQIVSEIESTLGPEVPTNETCEEPSMTCALFAAEKSVLASMDQLVKDGQQIVAGLQPFSVKDIRTGNDGVGSSLTELQDELAAIESKLGDWDELQGETLTDAINELKAAHDELSSAHTGLQKLYGDIEAAYERREEGHEQRLDDLQDEHDDHLDELETEHQTEIDELKSAHKDSMDSALGRVDSLLKIGPDAQDAQKSLNKDIEDILRNQEQLADELCKLRVDEPAPEPSPEPETSPEPAPTPTPTQETTEPAPDPSATPTDEATEPEPDASETSTEESAAPTASPISAVGVSKLITPADKSINDDIDDLRSQLVDTDCQGEPYDNDKDSLTTQVENLRDNQDDAWDELLAVVEENKEPAEDDTSDNENSENSNGSDNGDNDNNGDSEESDSGEELAEIPLGELGSQLKDLEDDIKDLEELVALEDVTNARSEGVKDHVESIVEKLNELQGQASEQQSALGIALDEFEADQEKHVEKLGKDINGSFAEAANTTRETFPAVVDNQIRVVSGQMDDSRESILKSYNTTISGLQKTSDAMVKDTGKQIEKQQSTLETQQTETTEALSESTSAVVESIHQSTSSSTRDLQGAAAQLDASLSNVILDLGDPDVQGSGILGSMAASSAMSETADYQLALASQRAAGYANVRSEDIAEIMLRQAQFSASLEAASSLPAFHLDVPSGARSQTVYAFHIGGDSE